jgi:valyl-tRNA synthetase
MELPKRYDPKISEPKWQQYWQEKQIFKFKEISENEVIEGNKQEIYSIDTPPPYASADHLHVGHGMHYSQFEFIARFQRMKGKNVFFPMGYDDNGLPTERFVEKKHNVNKSKITRADFVKLCLEETKKAGKTYHDLFTSLGFSIDWDLLYQTIGPRAQAVSQKSFIDLFKKERLERVDQPTMWCTRCQTTIAQADLENVDKSSFFNDVAFENMASSSEEDKHLVISTTRPELLAACVALFYHPDDERYQALEGKTAKVPLFDYEVPIMADESVAIDKGTGLMMVCTFGDKEDVEKWKKHKLQLRVVFDEVGRLNELAGKYQGLKVDPARKAIVNDLEENGLLLNKKEITHAVNVHERCNTPIEFMKKQQWQIKLLDKKEELLEIANKVNWYPAHMKVRYEHWVKNLQWNWGISRQRYYGVPFPVWYCKDCKEVLLPNEDSLPVDPRETSYGKNCTKCGSDKIEPEIDVMDTWMTSSLTPEINAHWGLSTERKDFLPVNLRPQAHDIIRTWTFYTIAKSYFHHNNIPWKNIMISGHGQDEKGHKMSKSKGNFVVANQVIEKYSADAFRFWAASAKLGDDLPYQEKDVLTGQKFVTKLWNASKFGLMHLEDYDLKSNEDVQLEIFDKWLLSKLQKLIIKSTEAFDQYEYSKTKSGVEQFFWHVFCDQYLEIVKDRLYNPDVRGNNVRIAAQKGLYSAILTTLKMMAPIMPHITEEIYQLYFAKNDGKESIHISDWPKAKDTLLDAKAELIGDWGVDIISAVRKFKSENQMSLKDELEELVLQSDLSNFEENVSGLNSDLKAVLRAKRITFQGEVSFESEKFKIKIGAKRTEVEKQA